MSNEVQTILDDLPEVDASYSEKIPLHERRIGLEDILSSLRKMYIQGDSLDVVNAREAVQPGGKKREFSDIDLLVFAILLNDP